MTSTLFHSSIVLISVVCLFMCWRERQNHMLRYLLITIAAFCLHAVTFSLSRLLSPAVSLECAQHLNLWSQAIRIHAGLTFIIVLVQVRALCSLLKP